MAKRNIAKRGLPNFELQWIATFACCALCLMADASKTMAAQQTEQPTSQQRTHEARVTAAGMKRYVRDSWSVLSVRAQNHSESPTSRTISVYLEEDNRTQFARRYWIPANATRFTWLPIRTPAEIENGQSVLHISVLNLNESGGTATLNRKRGEQLISKAIVTLDATGLNTGLIVNRPQRGEGPKLNEAPNEAYETTVAVRMLHDGERTLSKFSTQFLPPFTAAYDGLDQLVIANDRLATDSGGIAAIRNWIARGGHAWIMADRVEQQTLTSLLGNALPYETVDRIELNEFSIHTNRPASSRLLPEETWVAEEPVEFLRVAATSTEVYSSIDGWPASFSIPFGQGRVFFTTLAARGWRFQHDPFAEPTEQKRPKAGPTLALKRFAGQFNKIAADQTLLSEQLKPILVEKIGYKIPPRLIAAILLGLSCLTIAGLGIWLARRQQLERIAWVVPLCTTIPAIILIAIGSANTSSVPATASSLRLASIDSGMGTIRSETLTGFYSPETRDLPLKSTQSGITTPEFDGLAGVAKRATWDDNGAETWESVSVAAGSVRFTHTRESLVPKEPIRAQAQFGADGLVGSILGAHQLGEIGDAIIRSPSAPNSKVNIDRNGNFQAKPDDLLAKGEFITGTMLDNNQQHRQAIYREVLGAKNGRLLPGQPLPQVTTLFAWGESDQLGFKLPASFQKTGATLFSIPLELKRTPAKQPFLIPATFIRASNANAGISQSMLYDSTLGTWTQNVTYRSESMLRFVVPDSVIPCQIKTAELTLKIQAPSRTLEILGLQDGKRTVLETRRSPSGIIHLKIDDPKLLQLDEYGGLRFGIQVSQTHEQIEAAKNAAIQTKQSAEGKNRDPQKGKTGPAKGSDHIATWQVDYMRLQVNGLTD